MNKRIIVEVFQRHLNQLKNRLNELCFNKLGDRKFQHSASFQGKKMVPLNRNQSLILWLFGQENNRDNAPCNNETNFLFAKRAKVVDDGRNSAVIDWVGDMKYTSIRKSVIIGIVLKKFVRNWGMSNLECLLQSNKQVVQPQNDASQLICDILTVKDEQEQAFINQLSQLTTRLFKKLIKQIEDSIDFGKRITHQDEAKKVEQSLDNDRQNVIKEIGLYDGLYDVAYTPIIQSSGNYQQVDCPNKEYLALDVQSSYLLDASSMLQQITQELGLQNIQFPTSFGYGINGLELNEPFLAISEKSTHLVAKNEEQFVQNSQETKAEDDDDEDISDVLDLNKISDQDESESKSGNLLFAFFRPTRTQIIKQTHIHITMKFCQTHSITKKYTNKKMSIILIFMDYFKYCPWDGYRFSENDVQCFICRRPKYQLTSYIQEEQEQKKWEKILYEKQPYDDNYIDETFLQSVQKQDNTNNGPDYKQLISKTSDLIFAVNCVVFYLLSYFLMLHDMVNDQLQLYFWLVTAITCLIMFSVVKKMKTLEILSNIKSIGIYISILLLFSPVMQTVNQTYADNTIYVLTSVAILIYIFLKDYDYEKDFTELDVSQWASLVFSSLLASRLHNELQVFLMIFASNLLFIFVPILQRSIKQKYSSVFRVINLISTIGLGLSLLFFSYFLALLFFGCVFFITFVSPLQIIWLYQYKNTIRGPWDLPNVKQYD